MCSEAGASNGQQEAVTCQNMRASLKHATKGEDKRASQVFANAQFALFIVASFTKRFNGARLPYTELGYLHDTSMLYSEWIIIITNTVNIFTF